MKSAADSLLTGAASARDINDRVARPVLSPAGPGWWAGFAASFALLMLLLASATWLFARGVGIWGINVPVAWGFAIVNFVWWIGIGHAGTFISAILLLLNQPWRTSINRLTEAMTLFAVACAGLFPLLHLGRPWLFYWLIPYPNTLGLWPQFRSPLIWDFFAVFTYATVSLLFWYLGLIPDLATLRDGAKARWRRRLYGALALGWRGADSHWRRHSAVYIALAALATPLVISVHSIVGLDFAVSVVPGWHSTIFPPYFVAGAIFSGFAMVATIVIPLRRAYGFEHYITHKHLDNMAKVMLATGMMVTYGYASEFFMAWRSGSEFERYMAANRLAGAHSLSVWTMVACNCVLIQLLWFPGIRRSPGLLWGLSLFINVGMWLERYVIVVTSLHRDYLVSSWGDFEATFWDWSTCLGSIGLFASLIYIFVRWLPAIAMFEMRHMSHAMETNGGKGAEP
jgi:Ni/Fe-hydrogenase subunit HybB-like protein